MNVKNQHSIGIIGAGPTTVYFLCEIVNRKDLPKKIVVFEKHHELGKGNPFRKVNSMPDLLSNVTKREVPALNISFEQ